MLSLTDFEVTTMTPLADIEDDNEEFEDYGCGEAPILSTSNSLMASSDPSVSDSGGDASVNNTAKEVVKPSDTKDEGLFRTFLPKNSRSMSRDFLNETPKRSWRRMGGSSRKRASAVELNGEDYLVFERGCEPEPSRDDSINPLAYRGGTAKVIGMVSYKHVNQKSINSIFFTTNINGMKQYQQFMFRKKMLILMQFLQKMIDIFTLCL